MIQGGEHLRFAPKARDAFRVVHNRIGQDLERDLASERHVTRAVDLAHSAFAQRRDDFIRPDPESPGSGSRDRIIRGSRRLPVPYSATGIRT